MSSSWFLKSTLAAAFFRPTPEGQLIFTCPSPWGVFGRSREYVLSNMQAQQLVVRIGRAYVVGAGVTLALICAFVIGLIMLPQTPDQLFETHPVATVSVTAAFTVLLIGLVVGIVYQAAGTVLAPLPSTMMAREPYSLVGNLKKTGVLLTAFPTWLLVGVITLMLVTFPLSILPTYKSLSAGQPSWELFKTVNSLLLLVGLISGLVVKLKAQNGTLFQVPDGFLKRAAILFCFAYFALVGAFSSVLISKDSYLSSCFKRNGTWNTMMQESTATVRKLTELAAKLTDINTQQSATIAKLKAAVESLSRPK